ncbi:TPA: L-arabinose isomerase [Vibrio parahaemolyticus]|uniref:L-arabinose isomerase n=1 Tax=Vibrio parahaemolyticus TaxID=670 RepID=UPI00186A3EBF|nr:L-arabinose isomerase [Vibrio parahaemolyticus]MBE4170959.1 L-arabinose isomerase [Vibrio parahaemolyticus]MBE4292277.1 L-arabinose isomerase [Vibrio parahaemolyticus]MBM5011205.1 L-arabinose isomerase [Vibrio parahaemolyticus]MCR9710985.1 L-arabinose isomerase [Vibrio parahaemolyticus]MCR9759115.1 L-arabinose isomerase [Vibrio parahaemolyticus]
MKIFNDKQVWFVTGSQHLYGPQVLKSVAQNSEEIIAGLNSSDDISVSIANKGTVKTPDEILAVCRAANNDPDCIGLMLWMHTFSPAKMWIAGLTQLNKPFLHLHTQFNAALPWDEIDMDFMNLNQSAHGCREFGFIGTRLNIERKVVVGHWQEPQVHRDIDDWCRAAIGVNAGQLLKVARFGDNMRQVAVTEGNKVSAQIQFGYEVNAYGLGELSDVVNSISDADVNHQLDEYASMYEMSPDLCNDSDLKKLMTQEARLELGMESFLKSVGAGAFTNTFENLTGLTNLPGLATQRLMAKGFGYGGEGDWKTAAMTHIMKVMGQGKPGGTSFMEDYTYNFGEKGQVLGAHMLEVCPTIAAAKPRLEVHRHTIGCRCDIPRLIFSGQSGEALNVSIIDLGDRFRMIVNVIDTVTPPQSLPHLPVAHALWEPQPNLNIAAAAWIHAGGAHHAVYSQAVTLPMLADYAEILGIEMVVIDNSTNLRQFKQELRNNGVYYRLG